MTAADWVAIGVAALLIGAGMALGALLVYAWRPLRRADVTPKLTPYRPERIERGGQVMANRPAPPKVQRFPPRGYRGSDSLNPGPARTVESLTGGASTSGKDGTEDMDD